MAITINLKQARELVEFFGGEDQDVVLTQSSEGHSGAGLYAHIADYPEEGAALLAGQ